jgi:rhamnose transport system ATP-binding protein
MPILGTRVGRSGNVSGRPAEGPARALGDSHVECRGLSKHFGGVAALLDLDWTVRRGEIHGLCGENGAGKSTLGRIIAGSIRPDSGQLRVHDTQVQYRAPRDALADGTTIISQEPALVPQMSVLENVFLGHERSATGSLDRSEARHRCLSLADRVGLEVDPGVEVGTLRAAEQHQVEIMRALARSAQLIIMDEPTAALSRPDIERLHAICRALRAEGVTIIYISHLLADVLENCDRVTVLKDGRFVRTSSTEEETVDSLIVAMIGRELERQFPRPIAPPEDAPIALAVRGLSRPGVFRDVSFEVRAGEIVGLAGLVGAGRTEIARAVFGADPSTGAVEIGGVLLNRRTPRTSIRHGLALLPESRKDQGLVMMRSVRENVSLAHLNEIVRAGFIRSAREHRTVVDLLARVETRLASISMPVSSLSGGNQQKAALAKSLFRTPRVLLADEPTRGVDVGAKRAIYQLIHRFTAEGGAVLLISSELEELLGLAHRILVVRGGAIVDEIAREAADEESIMKAAFGVRGQRDTDG